MTITLSIEELRNHEIAINQWGLAKANEAVQLAVSCFETDHLGFRRFPAEKLKARLAEWEEKHPIPRLIPNV